MLSFYEQLRQSKLRIVNTCDEQGAGFAADAYARMRASASSASPIASAAKGGQHDGRGVRGKIARRRHQRRSRNERAREEPAPASQGARVRHSEKVFDQITIASTVLGDPQTALQEIDRVLHAALQFKRPVYIELPRDQIAVPGIPHHQPQEFREAATVARCAPRWPKPNR